MKTWEYKINIPSELDAGIRGMDDTVRITVESGDPGGEETGADSFPLFFRRVLAEWYDNGAGVSDPVLLEDEKIMADPHARPAPFGVIRCSCGAEISDLRAIHAVGCPVGRFIVLTRLLKTLLADLRDTPAPEVGNLYGAGVLIGSLRAAGRIESFLKAGDMIGVPVPEACSVTMPPESTWAIEMIGDRIKEHAAKSEMFDALLDDLEELHGKDRGRAMRDDAFRLYEKIQADQAALLKKYGRPQIIYPPDDGTDSSCGT